MEHEAKIPKLPLSYEERAHKEFTDTIGELEERLTEINSFDHAEMINFQCDDLIIEVSLAVQSQIEHLNKLETDLLEQIEKHRAERLRELQSDTNGKILDEMKQEIEDILGRIQELKSKEPASLETSMQKALDEATSLSLRASLFMSRIKRGALGQAMRFDENQQFLNSYDLVGKELASLEPSMKKALEEANELSLRASLFMSCIKRKSSDNALRFKENQQFLNSNDIVGKLEKASVINSSYKLSKFKPSQLKSLGDFNTYIINTVVFIRDDMLAFSTILSSMIGFWNPVEKRFLFKLEGHEDNVTCLAVLHNGWLASGSRDKTINIWNIDMRTLVRTLRGHECSIFSLVVLPNSNLASIADSFDYSIKVWNPCKNENNLIHSIKVENSTKVIGVLSNGFLVGYSTKKLHVFNPLSGKIVKSVLSNADELNASSLLVLKDDRVAVTFGLGNGKIEIFDLLDLENQFVITAKESNASLKVFAQLPNGLIVSSFCRDRGSKVMFRDPHNGAVVSTIPTTNLDNHTTMAVSKDGRFLAAIDFKGRIHTCPLTD